MARFGARRGRIALLSIAVGVAYFQLCRPIDLWSPDQTTTHYNKRYDIWFGREHPPFNGSAGILERAGEPSDEDEGETEAKRHLALGRQFVAWFAGNTGPPGQPFEYSDLKCNGYKVVKLPDEDSTEDPPEIELNPPNGKSDAYADLGILSTEMDSKGKSKVWFWMDDQSEVFMDKDGDVSQATKAYFINGYGSKATDQFAKNGVIYATSNESPAMILEKDKSFTAMPNLRTWADIAWLHWRELNKANSKRVQAKQIKSLKHVVRAPIRNDETNRAIDRALGGVREASNTALPKDWNVRWGAPAYPGIMFWMDKDPGKSLLGTPNGKGTGWLLANHQADEELGQKMITKVLIFDNQWTGAERREGREPTMIFFVEDAHGFRWLKDGQRSSSPFTLNF